MYDIRRFRFVNMLYRFTALLILMALCACMLPSDAETAHEYADTEKVPFVFYSSVNPKVKHQVLSVPYSDELFAVPATDYHHMLAQASLGLAFSNYREREREPEEQGSELIDFLTRIGFTDIQSDQYDVDTTSDTVASMIARKETVIDGKPCTIIAVSICGAGYDNEWLSNFAFSEEDRHSGFDKAADKVLGRILLYLFNHPSEHEIKLWISGYSRAAAIANLLGQKLSNEKICPVEDLFVYTFATPNTATNPGQWPCPSIFNIVGAFDPVPTVPPAEWGYTRYGTTLYLPAQEVDSDYTLKRYAVEPIYKELTSISFWNDPGCNWILQKLMQILYSNITSAELYSSFIKDIISGMWVTSGILPRIKLLSDMMSASVETDTSMRSLFTSVKEVLSPYLYNRYFGNGEERVCGRDDVSLLMQIMHEHNPDVYCAWMMSSDDPEKLFIKDPSYRRVSLCSGLTIQDISVSREDGYASVSDISGISFDVNTVLNIPGDFGYIVTLTAEREIENEEIVINGYRLPTLEANTTIVTLNLAKGESAELVLQKSNAPAIRVPDTSDVSVTRTHVKASEEHKAALYEYHQSGWLCRNLIDIIFILSAAVLCALAYLIIRLNIRKKKRLFYVRRAFLTLMAASFVLDQLLRNFFPWGVLPIIICQGICSVSGAVITFFAWRQKKDVYTLLLFLTMLFWTAGDVITKAGSSLGTMSYVIGHMILTISFCLYRRPRRKQYLILLGSAAIVYAVEILTIDGSIDLLFSMLYSLALLCMTIASSFRNKSTLVSGLLFLFSDLLLTLKNVLNAPGWLFLLTLGAYYLSIAILSYDAYDESGTITLKGR